MIEKILIIKIGAIGDLLLITPALRAIKKEHPNAKITLLVGQWSKKILEGNPYIDQFIEVPDELFLEKRFVPLLKLVLSLRKKRFDVAFVWHRSKAFRLFSKLLGIKTRVGFSREDNGLFLTHHVEENPTIHEMLEYQSTLKPLGIESSESDMDLILDPEDLAFAEKIWKENGLNRGIPVIAIAPGGAKNPKETNPTRRWPTSHYARTADLMMEQHKAHVLFLGTVDDGEIIAEVLAQMNNPAINLAGETNLKQLAAVIGKSTLFLGNDSAAMHIAAAVGTPTFSFFGPTDPKEKAPLGSQHKYFYAKTPCSPCYLNGKFPQCSHLSCMKNIRPEEVVQSAKILFNHSHP